MDREKLNKVARNYAAWETINSSDPNNNYYCVSGFIKGAEWLQLQPLAERLTEDEKKWINERYSYYMSEEPNCYLGSRMRNEYELIFGTELFKSN